MAAVFYSGTTMVLEGVSASEISSNLFLMKLTREFEKVGAKLKKSEANSMAKVLKHLEKRLAYVKDPASFIAKNESLKDSYEQFKESNVFSLELYKYVFTKCLNMFQHVIDIVAPEFQNGTHGAEVDKENSQGGSCELPVPPGKKIELWEGISNRAMLESYGLRAVFVDLLTSLKDIAASSDVDDSLYFVFYFDILRDSLARTTGAAQFQDVFRVTADTFKERIACASSGTLRKIANFAYQMAVHSTREKRLFSAFRSNIFSAVFSLEAMGTASKVDAKFEKTAYTRYQHAFSLFKKIIAAKETTSASVCENVLNKLSLSLLCFVSFHFTSKTNEDVVRVVNLYQVAFLATCQRLMLHGPRAALSNVKWPLQERFYLDRSRRRKFHFHRLCKDFLRILNREHRTCLAASPTCRLARSRSRPTEWFPKPRRPSSKHHCRPSGVQVIATQAYVLRSGSRSARRLKRWPPPPPRQQGVRR